MKEFFLRLFGYKYLLNTHTLEIHSLKNVVGKCRISMMSEKNKKYITNRQKKKLLAGDTLHNGCKWCLKEFDEG